MSRKLPNEKFIDYQREIASHPNYRGMPDLHNSDGTIQWEAPSNRAPGTKHAETHVKRRNWWKEKAAEVGISTAETQWISKTAKLIHPTGMKPCKICGHTMHIAYVYPNKNTLRKMAKYPELEEVGGDRFSTVYDVAESVYEFSPNPIQVLEDILSSKKSPNILKTDNRLLFEEWLRGTYVPSQPPTMSPGVMSNAPDRLDGFHSFNLCCRAQSDKGRSVSNLASYATDRRAFENWSEGNWVAANQLMGEIRKNEHIQKLGCANSTSQQIHSGTITADHIGPISLGFAHRPAFRLLCASCNSAKNNRMTLADVYTLRADESGGAKICSWYNEALWRDASPLIRTEDDVEKLNKMLRDNRTIAFELLGELQSAELLLSMATLLSPEIAAKKWISKTGFDIVYPSQQHIVSVEYTPQESSQKYRWTQQARMLRVSFEAIAEYLSKENRNAISKNLLPNMPSSGRVLTAARGLERVIPAGSSQLSMFLDSAKTDRELIDRISVSLTEARQTKEYLDFRAELQTYMSGVSKSIMSIADTDRYTRMLADRED